MWREAWLLSMQAQRRDYQRSSSPQTSIGLHERGCRGINLRLVETADSHPMLLLVGSNFRWTNCPRHPFLRAQIRRGKPKVRYKELAARSRPRRDLRAFALPPPEAPRRNACEDETLAS